MDNNWRGIAATIAMYLKPDYDLLQILRKDNHSGRDLTALSYEIAVNLILEYPDAARIAILEM